MKRLVGIELLRLTAQQIHEPTTTLPLMAVTQTDVEHLIQQPESQSLEFKIGAPAPRVVAGLLASFANSGGGLIVFGVRDDRPMPDRIVGVDPQRFEAMVERALRLVAPRPGVTARLFPLDGKHVGVVEVEPSQDVLTQTEGQALVRVGDRVQPATSEEILRSLPVQPREPEVLAELKKLTQWVAGQTIEIAKLRAAQGWRSQLVWALVSGVIGTVLGVIATLLLG
jgi:Putative DNA-binding domain